MPSRRLRRLDMPLTIYSCTTLFIAASTLYSSCLCSLVFFSTGEQDLHDVLSAAIEVAARWKYIGDMFQLSPGSLDTIEKANFHQPDDCLREVILRWLRRSGTSHSPPTWRRVVEVVGCPTGGNNPELARRIASQHSKGVAIIVPLCQYLDVL